MRTMIRFYFELSKGLFLKALTANIFGWLLTAFYETRQWQETTVRGHFNRSPLDLGMRLPVLLVFLSTLMLLWQINRMDVSTKTRTPGSLFQGSALIKLGARFLVSYAEIVALVLVEGIFLALTTEVTYALTDVLLFLFFVGCYCGAFIAYLILLRQLVKELTMGLPGYLTTLGYGVSLFALFVGNAASRRPIWNTSQIFIFSDRAFHPTTFVFNAVVILGIVWVYLRRNRPLQGRQLNV